MSEAPRVIAQIAVGSGFDNQPDTLYALADDGTIWRLSLKLNKAIWYRLPPLPDTTPDPLEREP